MKHARSDYDRIQDPEGLIPDEEPVFLLRGQDIHAVTALQFYASALIFDRNVSREMIRAVRSQIAAMERWQREVARKSPDMP